MRGRVGGRYKHAPRFNVFLGPLLKFVKDLLNFSCESRIKTKTIVCVDYFPRFRKKTIVCGDDLKHRLGGKLLSV